MVAGSSSQRPLHRSRVWITAPVATFSHMCDARTTKGGHRVPLAILESPVSKVFKRWWALPPGLPKTLCIQPGYFFVSLFCFGVRQGFLFPRSSPPCLPVLYCTCSVMNREIFRFEAEPAPGVRERRRSHMSGSDRQGPLAVTGGEIEFGLWWTFLFLRNALAEGHPLTGINR